MSDDYLRVNLANWNSRVPHHEAGYGLDAYRNDPAHLSEVVRFDLSRLGSVDGLDGVHLQCHIGTDTLSLARLGARMSGLDFSQPALDVAGALASSCGTSIDFRCADVYAAGDVFGAARFDLVYTGIGALCWLPDVARWAEVVAGLLRPGGRLFIREGHPMLWSLCDSRPDGLIVVEYPYFETDGIPFTESTTYVGHEGELESPEIVSFNHGLGEIFNALWSAGMEITGFDEHDSIPWNAFDTEMVLDESRGAGEYVLAHEPRRLAASYTLQAIKR
jgi:SAM-dependent methyltransferase